MGQVLRPILNRELGGFGKEFKSAVVEQSSFVDDMTLEWRRRIVLGDIVLYRTGLFDRAKVALVTSLSRTPCGQVADLVFFDAPMSHRSDAFENGIVEVLDWVVTTRSGVALQKLWPCLSSPTVGATVLTAALAGQDDGIGSVMKR